MEYRQGENKNEESSKGYKRMRSEEEEEKARREVYRWLRKIGIEERGIKIKYIEEYEGSEEDMPEDVNSPE